MKRSSHGSQYLYLSTLEAVPNGEALSICFMKAKRPLCFPFYLWVGLVGKLPHPIKVKSVPADFEFVLLQNYLTTSHGRESIFEDSKVIITIPRKFQGVYTTIISASKKAGSKGKFFRVFQRFHLISDLLLCCAVTDREVVLTSPAIPNTICQNQERENLSISAAFGKIPWAFESKRQAESSFDIVNECVLALLLRSI